MEERDNAPRPPRTARRATAAAAVTLAVGWAASTWDPTPSGTLLLTAPWAVTALWVLVPAARPTLFDIRLVRVLACLAPVAALAAGWFWTALMNGMVSSSAFTPRAVLANAAQVWGLVGTGAAAAVISQAAARAVGLRGLSRRMARMLLFIVLAFALLVPMGQLHRPRSGVGTDPGRALGLDYESLTVRTPDGLDLAAWFVPSPEPAGDGRAVLMVHGIGSHRGEMLPFSEALLRRGWHVLLLDLRAHGDSDGMTTTLAAWESLDVAAAFAVLQARPETDPERCVIWGFSMGGAAAAQACRDGLRPRGLAMESAPAGLPHMAERVAPLPPTMVRWTVGLASVLAGWNLDKVRPGEPLPDRPDFTAGGVIPVFIVHGAEDRMVPPNHAARYALTADRAGARVELHVVPDAGHGLAAARLPDHDDRLVEFFESCLPEGDGR